MDNLRRILSSILIAAIGSSVCLAFDTGSHFDLTNAVLREQGFNSDAVKIVQVENWLTDYYSSSPTIAKAKRDDLEKLHFDNLFSTAQVDAYWAWLLTNLKTETQAAARRDDPLAALTVMGIGLHAVQDFYTHSNWVETHPRLADGSFRTATYTSDLAELESQKRPEIFTGKYPENRTSGPGTEPIPANSQIHGDYQKGLNHDSLVRPRWDEAYVFAYVASHELVEAMSEWADEARPGFWERLGTYAVDVNSRKKLDYDVSAARNISMWIKGGGQDGHWKGDKSGSMLFFGAFALPWVASASSIFVNRMNEGSIAKAVSQHLYSTDVPPEMPEIPVFSLSRRAVVVRTTLVKDLPASSMLPSIMTGAPDFYSRTNIGEQEFWGRTIQASRETTDPWYEIYFADQDAVPVKISIWNEDSTDPAKDTAMDINSLPGKSTLDLLFNTTSGEITGDLRGKYGSLTTVFTSSGEKPDKNRATIKAYVTSYPLK
ncbi:MAG: hypothetical protein ACKVQJ_06395 [Pyrinomonadaceae bacterium]